MKNHEIAVGLTYRHMRGHRIAVALTGKAAANPRYMADPEIAMIVFHRKSRHREIAGKLPYRLQIKKDTNIQKNIIFIFTNQDKKDTMQIQ